jgi:membrane protein YqaA with SNARE-associated domain
VIVLLAAAPAAVAGAMTGYFVGVRHSATAAVRAQLQSRTAVLDAHRRARRLTVVRGQ